MDTQSLIVTHTSQVRFDSHNKITIKALRVPVGIPPLALGAPFCRKKERINDGPKVDSGTVTLNTVSEIMDQKGNKVLGGVGLGKERAQKATLTQAS